jgi:FAD synthetase
MKKVLTFGTFDLFHPGHEFYLRQAKRLGDHLTVIIALDQTVKQVKNFFPRDNQEVRLQKVEQSKIANIVTLGQANNKYQVLLDHKPDIIALGYDQIAFTDKLNQAIIDYGLNTQIVRIESYFPEKYKSSVLKNKHENI